jgi:hypothetical protein
VPELARAATTGVVMLAVAESDGEESAPPGQDLPDERQADERAARESDESRRVEPSLEILERVEDDVALSVTRGEVQVLAVRYSGDQLLDGNDAKTFARARGNSLEETAVITRSRRTRNARLRLPSPRGLSDSEPLPGAIDGRPRALRRRRKLDVIDGVRLECLDWFGLRDDERNQWSSAIQHRSYTAQLSRRQHRAIEKEEIGRSALSVEQGAARVRAVTDYIDLIEFRELRDQRISQQVVLYGHEDSHRLGCVARLHAVSRLRTAP